MAPRYERIDAVVLGFLERQIRQGGLAETGLGFEHVVKTTVYLADMNEFAGMNEVYSRFIVDPPPARATVQVGRLPRDVKIEVDCIAIVP